MRKFIDENYSREEANVIAYGVPIGRWSKEALLALRNASWFVEGYDVPTRRDLYFNKSGARVFDAGDHEIKNYDDMVKVTEGVKQILREGKIPITIGGGHLLSLYTMKAFPKDTKLVVFDAHCDSKDEYVDDKIIDLDFISDDVKINPRVNDVTWVRRVSEIIDPKNIVQFGLRSGDQNEVEYADRVGIKQYTPDQIKKNITEAKNWLKEFTKDSNVFISLDIDSFDPSVAPAVDHPEPHGLFFNEFQELINSISGKLVGIDVCCLKPIPGNEITEFLAIRSVFEMFSLIK